jgi:predicted alpha/beta superfamily hydrolase
LAISDWRDYTEGRDEHTVVGTLLVQEDVYSPQLDNHRNVYVYLPPSYGESQRRYPVLYMHDGQNLFDAAISYAGEWRVDETLQDLRREGIEAIVVGIANTGVQRMIEYLPFNDWRVGKGKGDLYLSFIAETLKPRIDADFRTLPQRETTGLMGSSMGGLISLYGFFHLPKVFGFAGVMSPALAFGRNAIYGYVRSAHHVPGKLYLDIGTNEASDWRDRLTFNRFSRRYVQSVREMCDLLREKGYRDGETLLYVEERGAIHNEADWARRLPDALRFLLGGLS